MPRSSKNYNRNRRRRLAAFQEDFCFFCDEPMIFPEDAEDDNGPSVASFDHFFSAADGGRGTAENTVIAHRQCNSKQNHRPKDEELIEKLRALNIKRGYGDENGNPEPESLNRYLEAEQFGDSQALANLLDRINRISKADGGLSIRRNVGSLLNSFNQHIAELRSVSLIQWRFRLAELWIEAHVMKSPTIQRVVEAVPDFPVESHFHNTFRTLAKGKLLDKKSVKKKKSK